MQKLLCLPTCQLEQLLNRLRYFPPPFGRLLVNSFCALIVLIDFLLSFFLCSSSNTENKRDSSPLKHISKSSNCSPAHRGYQRQTDGGRIQENHSAEDLCSAPAEPQDAHKPAANGVLAQMEKDKEEKVDKQQGNDESVRIETAGLVNGDMGDGSTEQSDDHSPSHTDRTDTESHTENEDSETKTESEHKNEEGSTDQKVRACLLVDFFFATCFTLLCVFISPVSYIYDLTEQSLPARLVALTLRALIDKLSAFIYALGFQHN